MQKHVCMTGFVAPLECRDTESCKEGTSRYVTSLVTLEGREGNPL